MIAYRADHVVQLRINLIDKKPPQNGCGRETGHEQSHGKQRHRDDSQHDTKWRTPRNSADAHVRGIRKT